MCVAELIDCFCRYTGRTTRLVQRRPVMCRQAQQRRGAAPGDCGPGLQRQVPARLEAADPYCPCARCRGRLQERVQRARARRRGVALALAESMATDILIAAAAAAATAAAAAAVVVAEGRRDVVVSRDGGDVEPDLGYCSSSDDDYDDDAAAASDLRSEISIGGASFTTGVSALSATSATTTASSTTITATLAGVGRLGGSGGNGAFSSNSSNMSTVCTSPASSVTSLVVVGVEQGLLAGQGGDKRRGGHRRGRMTHPAASGLRGLPRDLLRPWSLA